VIRTVVFIIAFSLCVSAVWARDERSIKELRDALVALAPDVDSAEAELVSVTAHTASRSLAREYGLVLSPIFQNFLIHMGKRERGYCGHYVRDIGERLKALKLKTLVLHWGTAYLGTLDESNCLVVTARNQPFKDGIVLDGWRRAGRLFWCAIKKDSEYDLGQSPELKRSRSSEPFRAQRPEDRYPAYYGITTWKEDPLYTAWLQDYEHVWEWQPAKLRGDTGSPGKSPPTAR
jgi:hypothetical protein